MHSRPLFFLVTASFIWPFVQRAGAAETTVSGNVFSEKLKGEPGTRVTFRVSGSSLSPAIPNTPALPIGPVLRYEKTYEVGTGSSAYQAWDFRAGPKVRFYVREESSPGPRHFLTTEGLIGQGRFSSSYIKTKTAITEGRVGVGTHVDLAPGVALTPEATYGVELTKQREDDAPATRDEIKTERRMESQLSLGLTAFW